MTRLEVRGVSASYGHTEVLHGVDLTVHAGTTTAILGASGCGKTTLLRVVAGFHTADAGQVRIGDRDVVARATRFVQVPVEDGELVAQHLGIRGQVAGVAEPGGDGEGTALTVAADDQVVEWTDERVGSHRMSFVAGKPHYMRRACRLPRC